MSPPTRVVWIEITVKSFALTEIACHHPHGWCGLKFLTMRNDNTGYCHHPHGWCGLKYIVVKCKILSIICHHPHGWCGLKYRTLTQAEVPLCHHPHGWCGLKLLLYFYAKLLCESPPTRVVWVK